MPRTTLFLCLGILNGLFTFMTWAPVNASELKPVILSTHNLYPYGYFNFKGEFIGSAVDVVRCIFDRMKQPYKFAVVPWKRAQKMASYGTSDGFFAASQNEQRDAFGVRTEFIADQNWTWFLLKSHRYHPNDPDFKEKAKVSSFLGANMHKWLIDNGFNIDSSPPRTTEILLMKLLGERIDAALANEQVMTALLAKHNMQDKVISVLNKQKPLAVYFSKKFLSTAPGFIDAFNSHVKDCRSIYKTTIYAP